MNAQVSWPSNFLLSAATVTLSTPASGQCAVGSNSCTYVYYYSLTTLGKGPGPQQVKDIETGYVSVAVTANGGGVAPKFSYFGGFIHNFTLNSGVLVAGTMTGPQWTNGSWNFGTTGTYTFTDPVYQTGSQIGYGFPNGWIDSSNTRYTSGNTTIAPNFEQGITLNETAAAMPDNDYGQRWAVLDGIGCGEGGTTCGGTTDPPAPTYAQMNPILQNISGTAYPTTGATSGVYLPVSGSISGGTASILGGGIYVEGAANSVTLTPGSSAGIESYTIVQNNTTTVITTNTNTNSTTIGSCASSSCTPSSSQTVAGVPQIPSPDRRMATPRPCCMSMEPLVTRAETTTLDCRVPEVPPI